MVTASFWFTKLSSASSTLSEDCGALDDGGAELLMADTSFRVAGTSTPAGGAPAPITWATSWREVRAARGGGGGVVARAAQVLRGRRHVDSRGRRPCPDHLGHDLEERALGE